MTRSQSRLALTACLTALLMSVSVWAADARRYASSDSDSGYVHWIDLYDTANRKITETSTLPYSPQNTCGRCHDNQAISHGWHFNAFALGSEQGRPSEPWIWSDARTGTQLPLSYRTQPSTHSNVFDPRDIGVSPWQMAQHFGARFPGGGFSTPAEVGGTNENDVPADRDGSALSTASLSPRWELAGALEIDCMVCHATAGQYDFESRRHHIEDENYAWAPTAAMHLGAVNGKVARIQDDADPKDEKTQTALPKVSYDASRFASDGKVFFDLVRKPENNACYQCHSTSQVINDEIVPRWIHDDDVHLRAGMQCVDCHRNGIEHQTVRGFDGEARLDGTSVGTLSCRGCHLGTEALNTDVSTPDALGDIASRAGRLGSPKPLHAGLPPIHFEKLSCTACHAGPAPRDEAIRIMTSLAHSLGLKERRSGLEPPQIQGPVYSKLADGKIYPQRVMWPAFWGVLNEDSITPLDPHDVADWTRKPLRIRKSFIEELASDPEKFDEKVSASLAAIEQQTGAPRAVYVSTGKVYGLIKDESDTLALEVLSEKYSEADMVTWPIAHNVRPAGWSLGVDGCVECHAEGGKIFASVVTPLGPAPYVAEPISMASLQGSDAVQRKRWNELFAGRSSFKVFVALSLTAVFIVLLIGVGSIAGLLVRHPQNPGERGS